MKSIGPTDIGALRNELNKYRKGEKLDIRLFNQVARLAWLGKIVLCRLDLEDPDRRSWLLHVHSPEGLVAELIRVDEDPRHAVRLPDPGA